jgi:hypothetical protein
MHQISGHTYIGKVMCKRHKVAIKKKIKKLYNKRMST